MSFVSAAELTQLEQRFSGGFSFVPPPNASPNDPVKAPTSVFDGHRFQARGTCKKRAHDYAARYERALFGFDRQRDDLVIVEMGILRGVGLAIWCELFPNARVIGLDVDLDHWHKNRDRLLQRGAFQFNTPEVHFYDELTLTPDTDIRAILHGDDVDIFIDDALHYNTAIVKAFGDWRRFMSAYGVYIVEDNYTVGADLKAAFPEFDIEQQQEMVTAKLWAR